MINQLDCNGQINWNLVFRFDLKIIFVAAKLVQLKAIIKKIIIYFKRFKNNLEKGIIIKLNFIVQLKHYSLV